MKLHANAPLGPKGRERMVLRVIEQGWSLTAIGSAPALGEALHPASLAGMVVAMLGTGAVLRRERIQVPTPAASAYSRSACVGGVP